MKPQQNETIYNYLENVKNYLLHVVPTNKDFLSALEQDLQEYANTNPGFSMEDLIDVFGPPELVAMQQIETLEKKDITKALKKRQRIIVAIIILCLLVVTGGYYIFHFSYLSQGTGTLSLEVEDSGHIDDSVLEN